MTTFTPQRVLEADIVEGSVSFPCGNESPETPYDAARVLVRVSGRPIGVVVVEDGDNKALLTRVRAAADAELADEIVAAKALKPFKISANAPFVTVTIPSLRNVQSAVECIGRILKSSYTNFEVVIVDNDADGTALSAAIEAAYGDNSQVRYAHEPLTGVSPARNKGLAEAEGDVIVYTDDDVYVDHRWLEALIASFDAADNVACVTGSILPAEMETPSQSWLEEYGGFNKGFKCQIFDLKENSRPQALYPFDAGRFGSGANMAFRTSVLRDLGGFSLDLGPGTPTFGGEDIDVLQRVVSQGYTLVYEPAALLWHFHRRSYDALRTQMYRYGVGFSALVAKWLLTKDTRWPVLKRLPSGLVHAFGSKSAKNEKKSTTYPSSLTWRERAGILVGPVAYLRSRLRPSPK